ncbi:hypothetical protein LUZ60_013866 [Juncus effusus]|nr:hypothetical protein LUZ60_013866 [Juncus effusus]
MLLLRLSLPLPFSGLSSFPRRSFFSSHARSPPLPLHFSLTSNSSPSPDSITDSDSDEVSSDEIRKLVELLPSEMQERVASHPERDELVEIVMDLGRRPVARFPSGDFFLSDRSISSQDILHATSQLGDFGADNRAGISRTLHRVSGIRNRKGNIIGLTCRVGRAVTGSANLLRDLVKDGSSILLLGPPGVGKTTIIREIARMLADDYEKRVMIVDTSNEIGGDGDIPHHGIGRARRMQVPHSDMQHKVLIEAVENHMPQVIVIDEIGTKLEGLAATTIAQRGIQLVATAHGITFDNLISNPSLDILVGGIQSVTLGDEEASKRGVQKTVLERRGPSTFQSGVEIISKNELRIHPDLESTVDSLLSGRSPYYEVRKLGSDGPVIEIPERRSQDSNSQKEVRNQILEKGGVSNPDFPTWKKERFLLFTYGITEKSVLEAIKQMGVDDVIRMTDDISEADALLALSSKLKKNVQMQETAESQGIPIFVTKTNTVVQVRKAIRALVNEHVVGSDLFEGKERINPSERTDALEEVRLAIEQKVIPNGESVQLLPRPQQIIYSQIELIESFRLKWEMIGQDPHVCLRILSHESSNNLNVGNNNDTNEEINGGIEDLNGSQNGTARLPFIRD